MKLRTVQRFLSEDGMFTVSTTVQPSRRIYCDCGYDGECKHLKWVKNRVRGNMIPLNLTIAVRPEDLEALVEGPLEDYEAFVSYNGKVEVI